MKPRMIAVPPFSVAVFSEPAARGIVYLHVAGTQAAEEAAAVWERLAAPKPVLAVVEGINWNRDLSPWYAERVFRGGEAFAGGAPAYLAELTERIIPAVESALPAPPAFRGLAGYSMAGLFAAWAVCNTPVFDRVASVSGSLWFDGFLLCFLTQMPSRLPVRAFFSVGDREKESRNQRMSRVEECTRQAAEHWRRAGIRTRFTLSPGGHFADVAARTAAGINFLTEE